MKKRMLCIVVSFILLMGCLNLQTIAAERVMFETPQVDSDGTTTTVTYSFTNLPEGKSATLVTMYVDKETEKILAINAATCEDVSLLEDSKISVTLADKSEEGGVLRHYLWTSNGSIASLANYAPISPINVIAGAEGNVADLSWEASDDDYDDPEELTYNVYNDGMLVAEKISGTNTEVDGLIYGEDYHFTLTANDTENAESEHSEIVKVSVEKTGTMVADNRAATSSNPVASNDGKLLFAGAADQNTYYSYYENNIIQGIKAYSTKLNASSIYTRIPFRVNTAYADELKRNGIDEFGYEITFFDSAELGGYYIAATVSWGSNGATSKNTEKISYIPITGTNTWKRVRMTCDLDGGWFAPHSAQPRRGMPHFEFHGVKGKVSPGKDQAAGPLAISQFTLLPKDEFNSYCLAAGAYISANDGALVSCGMTSSEGGKYIDNGISVHSNRYGIDLEENDAVTFTVENENLIGSSAEIIVCCYSEEKTEITLGDMTLEHNGNGWQKIRFNVDVLTDAEYSVSVNGGVSVNSIRVIAD